MFKNIFGGFDIPTTVPTIKFPRNENVRRKEEEIAYKINNKLGEVVERKNNIGRTVDNVKDSICIPIFKRILEQSNDFGIADHLYIQCLGFTHHGLYIGDGMVIHYSNGIIKYDSIEEFSGGRNIYIRSELDSPIKYSRSKIIERAKRRVYECDYNLVINNCEHFVLWCRSGM